MRSPSRRRSGQVSSLRDEEPVLDRELLDLAAWIAEYYCAPIGEVLKGMLPLSGETRRSTRYTLTDPGRQVARQLIFRPDSDPASRLLGSARRAPARRCRISLLRLKSRANLLRAAHQARLGRGRRPRRRPRSAACCRRTFASRIHVARRGGRKAQETRARAARFSRTASRTA